MSLSRQERIEELAQVLREAEKLLLRAHLIARDLGYADMAAQLSALIASLREE